MKTKLPKPLQFAASRKNSLIPIILFMSMIGITTSCQSSFTQIKPKVKTRQKTPPAGYALIIYGKVDSIPPELMAGHVYTADYNNYTTIAGKKYIRGMGVAIIPHTHPCSDSTGKKIHFLAKRSLEKYRSQELISFP